ncbi:MAG: type II toxin-antitoxin system Phd/YefM family antitoxin [Coriobacteriia bacterium]|nr:type II toxin-antitoxin system Phd/YefM family antitoxin [Coriobacteriia bacterium]
MITTVNAMKFRQNLGQMLSQVQYRNDSIVIEKAGEPVAALIDIELFQRLRRDWARFDELSAKIASDFADISEEEGMAIINDAVAEVRGKAKGSII